MSIEKYTIRALKILPKNTANDPWYLQAQEYFIDGHLYAFMIATLVRYQTVFRKEARREFESGELPVGAFVKQIVAKLQR